MKLPPPGSKSEPVSNVLRARTCSSLLPDQEEADFVSVPPADNRQVITGKLGFSPTGEICTENELGEHSDQRS